MKKVLSSLISMAFITTMSAPILADDFYVGIGAGEAKFKDSCSGLDDIGVVNSCDDNDTAWKLYGGYQFNSNFAVEAFYADFGENSATVTVSGTPVTATAEVSSLGIVGVGILPVSDNIDLFAKVGLYRWDADVKSTVGFSDDDDGVDVMFGLGASYAVTEHLKARVEWEHFSDVDADGIQLLSAGLAFSF